jgi:hypothetical protein
MGAGQSGLPEPADDDPAGGDKTTTEDPSATSAAGDGPALQQDGPSPGVHDDSSTQPTDGQ